MPRQNVHTSRGGRGVFKAAASHPSLYGLSHVVGTWGKSPRTSTPREVPAGSFCSPRDRDMRERWRNCGSQSCAPSPCRARSLAPSCDLNTGLEGAKGAGGPDLPGMPDDKPLPGLTPSNITPLKGLSAYWLKKKIERWIKRCPKHQKAQGNLLELPRPRPRAEGENKSIVRRRKAEGVWKFQVTKIMRNAKQAELQVDGTFQISTERFHPLCPTASRLPQRLAKTIK